MNRFNPNIVRFLAVSALALAVPLTALAEPAPGPGRDQHGGRPAAPLVFHLLRGLDLTEAQQGQIRALVSTQREQMHTTLQSVHSQRKALRQLALSDKYDAAAVKTATEQLGQAEGEAARLAAEGMQKVYAILTPEQRAQLQVRMSRREEHHEARG